MLRMANVGIAISPRGVPPLLEPVLQPKREWQAQTGEAVGMGVLAATIFLSTCKLFFPGRVRNLGIPTAAPAPSLLLAEPILVLLDVLVVVPSVRDNCTAADHLDLHVSVSLE